MPRSALFALALLAVAWCPALAIPPEPDGHITEQMVQEDARLSQARVTLRVPRATLGDLLEEIRIRSGIPVSTGTLDGSQDIPVSAFCDKVEAVKVLNGLWSLLSYKEAEWEWRRTGKPGSYSYRLAMTSAASRFGPKMVDFMWATLDRHLDLLMTAAEGSDAQKQAALIGIYGDVALYPQVKPDLLWSVGLMLKVALTPEQRRAVLHGKTLQVPIASLDPQHRPAPLSIKDPNVVSSTTTINGVEVPRGEPTSVCFLPGGNVHVPAILVSPDNGWMTMPAVGGTPVRVALQQRMLGAWMLEGDKDGREPAANAFVARQEAPIDPPAPVGLSAGPNPTAKDKARLAEMAARARAWSDNWSRRMEQIAVGFGVPLLARLPREPENLNIPEPQKGTLGEYVGGLWVPRMGCWRSGFMLKRRDGVLLATTSMWPLEPLPPDQELVRKLRRAAKPGEYLPFDLVVEAADTQTAKQLEALAEEFPVMARVAQAQGLFALFRRCPRLLEAAQSRSGIVMDEQTRAQLSTLPMSAWDGDLADPKVARVRIVLPGSPTNLTPHTIQVWTFGADLKPLRHFVIDEVPQPPDRPKEAPPE